MFVQHFIQHEFHGVLQHKNRGSTLITGRTTSYSSGSDFLEKFDIEIEKNYDAFIVRLTVQCTEFLYNSLARNSRCLWVVE